MQVCHLDWMKTQLVADVAGRSAASRGGQWPTMPTDASLSPCRPVMSKFFEAHPMLLFALEAGLALFLLIFIVVWTMGTAKKNPRPSRAPDDHPSRAGQDNAQQGQDRAPGK